MRETRHFWEEAVEFGDGWGMSVGGVDIMVLQQQIAVYFISWNFTKRRNMLFLSVFAVILMVMIR